MPKNDRPRKSFKRLRDESHSDEREVLFEAENDKGEMVEYTVPKKVNAAFSLTAMRKVAELGENAGTYWMLNELLSDGGFAALEDSELSAEDLTDIFTDLRDIVFGGNPKNSKK